MTTADTGSPRPGRRVRGRRAVPLLALGALLLTVPHAAVATAQEDVAATLPSSSTEPPGLDGRDTHLTRLTAHFSECFEVVIPRGAQLAALAALVPDRYTLFSQSPTPGLAVGRVSVIDASCVTSVDDQQRARRSTVTLGLASVVARDGVATPTSYYLLWIGTDDAVLAARLRQVGLPAEFLPASSTSEQAADGSSVVAFELVGDGLDHAFTAEVVEPAPTILPPGTPFTAYYDGSRGDVRLRDVNALTAGTAAVVTGSLTGIEVLQPLLTAPRFATLNATRFLTSFFRGGWTRTVERLD